MRGRFVGEVNGEISLVVPEGEIHLSPQSVFEPGARG